MENKGIISLVRAYIIYSLKEFFQLLGISLDNYLYLVSSSFKLKQVSMIKSNKLIKLYGVNNRD